jgi:hypothetical protein
MVRGVLISRLESYAAAGRFPHNHVAHDRVPVFRDEHSTLCAMGFLIASTGNADLVNDVAGKRNLAYIPELADDIRLQRWLDSTGLTVAEAARIQPMYGCGIGLCRPPSQPAEPARSTQLSREYVAGSMLGSALNGASLVMNLASMSAGAPHAKRNAILGALTGIGQIALGASHVHKDGAAGTIGFANAGVGAASLAAGAWRLRHLPQPRVASRSLSIVPFIVPDGRAAGLSFAARM